MIDNILITGITPLDYYPDKCSIKNSKQNIKSINLCIPCQKPDMESINDIKVSFCINSYKLLNTILGPKILINITSKIKVIYTAKNIEQSLHSAHWNIDFCDFILLEDLCYDECNLCISNLFIGLEDVCILYCDERAVEMSLLYIICINFKINHCSQNYNCKTIKDCEHKNTKKYHDITKNGIKTYYYTIDYYEDSSCYNQNPYKSD